MIKKWKKKSSKYLLENKIFKMREDLVTSPKLSTDHKVWGMEVPTWGNIIPITPQNDVVLVDQYRFGSEKSSLEIPGGMADPGEALKKNLSTTRGFFCNASPGTAAAPSEP